jgi:hypothetical protein
MQGDALFLVGELGNKNEHFFKYLNKHFFSAEDRA